METEDKHPRLLKQSVSQERGKKFLVKAVSIVLVCAAIILLGLWANNTLKQHRSKNLTNSVTHSRKTLECKDGLKQIGDVGSKLKNSLFYTTAAREDALDYLMSCEAIQQNYSLALSYASELNSLYAKEGNTQKQQSTTGFINYINDFKANEKR